jgi:glycogen debranching enzyme
VICVRAPLMAISAPDGQVRRDGAQGFYLGDHRSLSRLVLTINGKEPTMLSGQVRDATDARFIGHHREPGGSTGDDASSEPQFLVRRTREVRDGFIRERIKIGNCDREPWHLNVSVEIACDFADIDEVKAGAHGTAGTVHQVRPDVLGWRSTRVSIDRSSRKTPGATVRAVPKADKVAINDDEDQPATIGWFSWDVRLKPTESWTGTLIVSQPAPPYRFPFERPRREASWSGAARVAGPTSSRPIDRLLKNSLADLDALRLTAVRDDLRPAGGRPVGEFAAAGAPWYLTLFGRDSLWTARMLLPIDRSLALGTLTMLSRYQGDKADGHNDERPGKIPHELRGGPTNHGGTLSLPPIYYGSVDSTLLFIILLVETWRLDRDDAAIRGLLPALRSALNWLDEQAADHEYGFIAYEPKPGQLSHQGWKDSPEAVTFASGRPAHGPIALCEVQAYAYEAAVGAAEMLEYLDGADAAEQVDHWRQWAAMLRNRFREAFWVEDAFGHYPAIALDRDLARVDGPSSNIGHLLSGGLLDDDEAAEVTELLLADGLNSGWGIRTRSAELVSYNPFGYHCGSVWPHDTAITVLGLLERDPQAAAGLAQRLLEASTAFGFRLPELYAGISREESTQPVPVRGACLPQAWASASAIVIAQALGSLELTRPHGFESGRL